MSAGSSLLAMVFAGFLTLSASQDTPHPVDACPGPCLDVTSESFESTVIHALEGSRDSARALANYFAGTNDLESARYWTSIALENGDETIRYNLAYLLYLAGDRQSLHRALFHLRKIEAVGSEEAIELRAEVEASLRLMSKRNGTERPQ